MLPTNVNRSFITISGSDKDKLLEALNEWDTLVPIDKEELNRDFMLWLAACDPFKELDVTVSVVLPDHSMKTIIPPEFTIEQGVYTDSDKFLSHIEGLYWYFKHNNIECVWCDITDELNKI